MAVSDDDVRHVAGLARIGLDPERIPQLVRELNGILEHMEVLAAVESTAADATAADAAAADAAAADAAAATGESHGALRSDEPVRAVLAVERHEFAPAVRDGFFLVPRLSTHGDAE
jgi:aspartyl-tRNA(Asn)/glutamyl-tRNA(Gln) amidotransferase subunit C